jgi:ferredoxin
VAVKHVLFAGALRYAFGMRVRVDPDLCEGYGLCVQMLPAVFEMGEDVPVKVVADPVEPSLRAKLKEAVAQCPRNALRIED